MEFIFLKPWCPIPVLSLLTKMRILNITFSIDNGAESSWVMYVKKNILSDDTYHSSLLRIHSDESTHPSYGVQFNFDTIEKLNVFKAQQLPLIYAALHKEFPNKWVMFETELETILP